MRDTSLYQVNDTRVPSVTEVLDIAGVSSYGMVPQDVLEFAAERGRRVHDWTEWLDGFKPGQPEPPTDGIEGYCAAYKSFLADTNFKIDGAEEVVVHTQYHYAGMYDRIGRFPGEHRLTLVDIKNVASLVPQTRLQLAGYAMAYRESPGIPPINRVAINLQPDGKYRKKNYKDDMDYHDWLACVRIAHWKLRHGLAELKG